MTSPAIPLDEQRAQLRAQLATQRATLAGQLPPAGATRGAYPRSITMRWLIREPELVARLVARLAGSRVAGAMQTVAAVGRLLRDVTGK